MAAKLTKKQRGFIKDYIKTGNGTLAAKRNYDVVTENTAAAIATENLKKPQIVKAIEEAFPDENLYELHREGLETDDLGVRKQYLDMAYKLKGSYAAEKHMNVNISATSEDLQALADKAAELLKQEKL